MKLKETIYSALRKGTGAPSERHSFQGAQFVFATQHEKTEAAREPFARVLGATVNPLSIASDTLGTFTGEIERPGSMLDALRGKIRLARKLTTERWVLVSEGSFSSADGFGLVVHGIEMLMLHDGITGTEIIEQHISYDTNYATATLTSTADLDRFLTRISFGSHALVLYPEGVPLDGNVRKGITDRTEAERILQAHLTTSPNRAVLAMSDMRAHLNPTRMVAIKACCELLANRLNTKCPLCESSGFGLVAAVPGLTCEECGAPTQRARGERHACPLCKHTIERPRSDGKAYASAAECEWCNP
ncbi:MAG: hypothetical protein RIS36_1886 [Pseudomonadota bacterium]|jgi:hypothetical protein